MSTSSRLKRIVHKFVDPNPQLAAMAVVTTVALLALIADKLLSTF